MSRKKSGDLTPRQRQSQQIMRQKAAQKKRRAVVHKLQIAGGGLLAVVLLSGGIWAWRTDAGTRAVTAVTGGVYQLTARAGFTVQALYLEGRSRTSMAEIDSAMGVKKGDPILQLSINELRERLESIESVKFAAVERALPGTLYIRIVEREPVALWQHDGKQALVDDNGKVMTGIDSAPYQKLPLIIGEDAPQHIAEMLTILATEPAMEKHFAAAIRVGDRRWNIRLDNGVEVRLPESDPATAWKKFAELDAKEQLLKRDVKVIDMRLPGRMFIKLAPEDIQAAKHPGARET